MFSLNESVRYWLYNKPVDMRKSFNGLSGIVTNAMFADVRNKDVYVFVNANRNIIKMLRREECGMVIYAARLDMGRMKMPFDTEADTSAIEMGYAELIEMVKSAMESPYVRRMKILAKSM